MGLRKLLGNSPLSHSLYRPNDYSELCCFRRIVLSCQLAPDGSVSLAPEGDSVRLCPDQPWWATEHFVQALGLHFCEILVLQNLTLHNYLLHINCVLVGWDSGMSCSMSTFGEDKPMNLCWKISQGTISELFISETDGEINLDSLPHICQCPSINYQMEMEAEELLYKGEVRVCRGWKHVDANRQHHALQRSEKLQVNRLVCHGGMLTGSRLFPWWRFRFVLRSWLIFTPAFIAFDSIKD